MKVETIVTYLEMQAAPKTTHHMAPPVDSALLRADHPPLHFYRYLYREIGSAYKWVSRKKMTDQQLTKIIHNEKIEIFILYKNGVPAGFAELDFRKPKLGDLVFLGLMPEYIGHGLGRFLLQEIIQVAWDKDITRMTVETCTLDHPRALPLYQRAGFTPFNQKKQSIEVEES